MPTQPSFYYWMTCWKCFQFLHLSWELTVFTLHPSFWIFWMDRLPQLSCDETGLSEGCLGCLARQIFSHLPFWSYFSKLLLISIAWLVFALLFFVFEFFFLRVTQLFSFNWHFQRECLVLSRRPFLLKSTLVFLFRFLIGEGMSRLPWTSPGPAHLLSHNFEFSFGFVFQIVVFWMLFVRLFGFSRRLRANSLSPDHSLLFERFLAAK